jgi:HEAT repeat protein
MKNFVTHTNQIPTRPTWLTLCLHLLAALLLILTPILLARGQKPETTLTISDVSAHNTQNGTVVNITADGSLSRTHTWQDREGFHVLVPDANISDLVKPAKGYKVRRSGSSIEILLQTNLDTAVAVQTDNNHINLSVNGKLEGVGDPTTTTEANQQQSPSGYSLPDYGSSNNSISTSSTSAENTTAARPTADTNSPAEPARPGDNSEVRQAGEAPTKITVGPMASEDEGFFSAIYSGTGVLVSLVVAGIALFVVRKLRSKKASESDGRTDSAEVKGQFDTDEDLKSNAQQTKENGSSDSNLSQNGGSRDRAVSVRSLVNVPTSVYGAYRIDQEVTKLIQGSTHGSDVLSSRASEDRRAIEASLTKIVLASNSSDEERNLAREALEKYGFVARQSVTLLSASDPFERLAAARVLGDFGSSMALPFLLEAIHDTESIVRNQVVVSIGLLKVPSAIGILLDLARRHPDLPAALITKSLTDCSVDGLDLGVDGLPATSWANDEADVYDFYPSQLQISVGVEALVDSEDEQLAEEIAKAFSADLADHSAAVKNLAQHRAANSVVALSSVARHDSEAVVRALALSSLASLDHESVFPSVLIGMADDSREVRAAAARALSRLSFDRASGYIHVLQAADEELLRDVAHACIKAGIVSQNVDRLASVDRRQAYESFALVGLLAKAHMIDPLLEAISHHSNDTICMNAIRLLGSTGEPYVFDRLEELSNSTELEDTIKTAVLDAMYKLKRSTECVEPPVDEMVVIEPVDDLNKTASDTSESTSVFDSTQTQSDETCSNLQGMGV